MAITLRSRKGSALTHVEVDTNFRSFYNSASINGNTLSLFTSESTNARKNISLNNVAGVASNNQIIFRSGSTANLGSNNLQFRHATNLFKLNGNAEITGSIIVKGTLRAEQIHTTFTSSSVIYQSGSTKFGNTPDDKHQITGSVQVAGNTVFSGSIATRGEVNFTNQKENGVNARFNQGWTIMADVSRSHNFPNDSAAALAGVPLGGVYRNGNFIQIRIS